MESEKFGGCGHHIMYSAMAGGKGQTILHSAHTLVMWRAYNDMDVNPTVVVDAQGNTVAMVARKGLTEL